tara:strand:+ start:118513 stop:119187 length:675 start_codon:yes stop_codon:yes gene_type:complete
MSRTLKRNLFKDLGIAIVGGLFAITSQFLIGNMTANSSKYSTDNQTIVSLVGQISELQQQYTKLQEQYTLSNGVILTLQKEIAELKELKNYDEFAVSSFSRYMPLPTWLKEYDTITDTFIMKTINRAYENQFGIMAIQYEGHTDAEIWGDDLSKEFEVSDKRVMKSLAPEVFIARIPNSVNDIDGEYKDWLIAKFPVSLKGTVYDAVGGIAIPQDLPDDVKTTE